jgi:hypothetical protein
MSPLKRIAVYSIILAVSAVAGVWSGEKLYASAHPVWLLCPPPPAHYMEYRGDGTVWVRWPDGRFVEVVPK